MNKKAVWIEIRWDDGSVSSAEGEHATDIMQWWTYCELMSAIHGVEYKGKPMVVKKDGE